MQLPPCPGRRHKTREKQAHRFIPESFCSCDTLLSQPDRMRNKYHQNTTREAILEVFIAQPHWRMFGHLPRQPILAVFPSQFLNFWALTQTESGLFEVCLSMSARVSQGRAAEAKGARREQMMSSACAAPESSTLCSLCSAALLMASLPGPSKSLHCKRL